MFRRKAQSFEDPEWLFVGLGNVGGEYDGTRHNVGFEVISELSKRHRIRLKTHRLRSNFGVGRISEVVVALARPLTFMNASGSAVGALVRHFNLKPERCVVIYDDMDLEVGRVQIRPSGGAGSHNGMKDIVRALGTREFPRIRLGIGSPIVTGVDHVLSRFTRSELELIVPAIGRAADGCELICTDGLDIAMNRINSARDFS